MGKQTICEIFLDSNSHCGGVYHSGQRLTGNVVLTFYENQKVKEIQIQILGIGKVSWSEQRRVFNSEEVYLKSETKICESKPDKPVLISPGVYTYPFECDLPGNIPTSCEGKYGFIRYFASVHIIRPALPIQIQTVPFTVIKPYNLNAVPIFQCPTKKQQNITFFQLSSLKLNNVSVAATLPTSGFAPGQTIPLQLEINNKSCRNISEFKIELNKVFVYCDKTQKHTKKHKLMLAAEFIDGCLANTCNVYQPEIVVPPVPATDVVSSKILHITYELKIYANFGGNILKPLIKLAIVIGTVPLYSTYRCVHFEDSNHIEARCYEALTDDYLNFGSSNSKHNQYAPVYPIFKMRKSAKCRKNSERSSESSTEEANSDVNENLTE